MSGGRSGSRKPKQGAGRQGRSTRTGTKAAEAKGGGRGGGRGKGRDRGSGGARPPGGGRRPPASDRGLGGTQVEGRHAVRELLLAGTRPVREVLIADELDGAEILDDIGELATELGVAVRSVGRKRLSAEAATSSNQGVVARAGPLREASLDELISGAASTSAVGAHVQTGDPFLLVLDGVTDPGNLGALLRTGECAGVTGVVLGRHRSAHITPTVAKAAAGAIEHLPMTLVGGIPTAIADLTAAGVATIGLDAGGDRSLFDAIPPSGPVALILGAEGRGLSRLARQRADMLVAIPLSGALNSLNVAAAAAVACFEVVRRREGPA